MAYADRQNDPLISRRALLRGAAGLGLTAATGTLLPSCGWGGGNQAEGADADGTLETTSIRLHAVPPAACYAPGYMAEQFLREEGFTDIQYPKFNAKNFVSGFVAGEIDFGIGYAAAWIPVIDAGAPLVMLSGLHIGCWRIFATGDIRSVRDFKDKTISVIGPDFTDGIFMAMTMANVGLDLRKDVKIVNYPPTENARILSSREVDAVVAFPPFSTDLLARGIGHVVLNSLTDPPWSNYFCCMATANTKWMEKHPVAAKRALRAMLRAADVVANEPDRTARLMVDRGYANNFDYTCDALKEIPYNIWRDYDPGDTVRFYTLRLKEAGIIESTPDEILKRGTDFRYLEQLKKELRTA